MIKLKNVIEVIQLVWRSKKKKYLVLYSTTNSVIANVIECDDFKEAYKRAIDLIRSGDTLSVRIVLEITSMDSKCEIKK